MAASSFSRLRSKSSGPQGPGAEFVALCLFDPAGNLLEAKIDGFGPRSSMDEEARRKLLELRLSELGHLLR